MDLLTQFHDGLMGLMTGDRLLVAGKVALIVLVGWTLALSLSRGLGRLLAERATPQQLLLAKRGTFYALVLITILSAMHQAGLELSALLGAAGILTVALGFASQTAASNIISGIFLLAERAFEVGDMLRVGDVTGTVTSIDLLSVKLRTLDNVMVRFSNEALLKAQFSNLSHYPIRRLDMQLAVAYSSDLSQVRKVLMEVADKEPLCMDEPEAVFVFQGFGDSSMNVQFSIWAARENFLKLRSIVPEAIKRAFDEAGIEIPYPQRVLHLNEPLGVSRPRFVRRDP